MSIDEGSELGDDTLLCFVKPVLLGRGQDWIEGFSVKAETESHRRQLLRYNINPLFNMSDQI